GVLVGNLGWFVGADVGVDYLLVGLLPHGIFELPALFVAAGVGFRLLHRAVQRLLGRRDALVSKPYLRRTALLVLVAWLALVLAAVIEATVTGALLDALFADRIDTQTAAANETAASVTALVTGR
ncbi:MAG: stage II sporulation protein M, partial [Natrialbaceae archaeon]